MNWTIEYFNGKKLIEKKDPFNTLDKNLINKIYFTDGTNQYGFFMQTGMFFINNQIFDFKIKIDDYMISPFQSKTVRAILTSNNINESIECFNLGYRLFDDTNQLYEYILMIYPNGKVDFTAKLYDNNRILIKIRQVRLH